MSKHGKSGGPGDTGRKHPAKSSTDKRSSRELLDELNSIQSLLGDAAADVDPQNLSDDDDIPTLPASAEDGSIGDAHAQIPLLGSTPPGSKSAASTVKTAPEKPTERVNPFLSSPSTSSKPAREAASLDIEKLIAQRAQETIRSTAQATSKPSSASPTQRLSEQQVRALAEEVLAEWMPKIERDLRNRLIDALKNNH